MIQFQHFPLFRSHLDLAHFYWEKLLLPGDWAIDATCGNGYDTLKLAKILEGTGGVIGLDIQETALSNTRMLIKESLDQTAFSTINLFLQSHTQFPDLAKAHPIRLIVFNLGYLPRSSKQITTTTETTLTSVKNALELVMPGGAISITCYPGHEEGFKEQNALASMFSKLNPRLWNVCAHQFINRKNSPSLFLLQKSL